MSQLASISQKEASQFNLKKYKAFIDTDIGDNIDDALALAVTLSSPEIDLLGVTTVFGDTQRRAYLALTFWKSTSTRKFLLQQVNKPH